MYTHPKLLLLILTILAPFFSLEVLAVGAETNPPALPPPLTPPAPDTPRINGPSVFGVRPGSPFFYAIPATGVRPMSFSVEGLPKGLAADPATGLITGKLDTAGEYRLTLVSTNPKGTGRKPFKIVVGEEIALTHPKGWKRYNCFDQNITHETAIKTAKAIKDAGLDQHGWSYVNLDD